LYFAIPAQEGNYLWRLPHLIAGWPEWINKSVDYLLFEWLPIDIYDPEIDEYEKSPLLKEVTRAF
jgi:glycine betaine/proline transport system permease protein